MSELVSTNWLFKNSKNIKLIILDCSLHMPYEKRNAKKEYNNCHIENAFFFDIEKISNTKSKLPHMIPNSNLFKIEVKKFGINSDSIIVVYDSKGIFSSARVWWMFKYFGHKQIFVLNGGLIKWLKENKPITNKKNSNKKGNFKCKISKQWLVNKQQVLNNIYSKTSLLLDARDKNRFNGIAKEPRKNIRLGHIPESKNIFWKDLITSEGTLISKQSINNIFKNLGVKNKKIITSCGSGITACVLSLSLLHGLKIQSSVYDGSWTEWAQNKKLPIEI